MVSRVPAAKKSKGKGSPHSITERRDPELIPVLGSQPAVDVSHKPSGRLPLLSAGAHSYPRNPSEGCYQFCCLVNRGTIGVNSLPKTVTRQRRDCDLNPGPSAPESSTLITRLPSHPREKNSVIIFNTDWCFRSIECRTKTVIVSA